MWEVIILQQIFLTSISVFEYAKQGKDFAFPVPDACPNPGCLMSIALKKHGFYERNCLDFTYRGAILIRRYYCLLRENVLTCRLFVCPIINIPWLLFIWCSQITLNPIYPMAKLAGNLKMAA